MLWFYCMAVVLVHRRGIIYSGNSNGSGIGSIVVVVVAVVVVVVVVVGGVVRVEW